MGRPIVCHQPPQWYPMRSSTVAVGHYQAQVRASNHASSCFALRTPPHQFPSLFDDCLFEKLSLLTALLILRCRIDKRIEFVFMINIGIYSCLPKQPGTDVWIDLAIQDLDGHLIAKLLKRFQFTQ